MSVSMALKGEGFSIVAVDTRTTNIAKSGKDRHKDDTQKIFRTKFGWIGESGGVIACSTRLREYIDTHDIKTKQHLYTAWLTAQKQVDEDARKYSPETLKILSNVQTVCSLNYFKDGVLNMDIEVIDFAYKMRKLKDNYALFVSRPKNTDRIKRLITKYEEKAKHVQGLYESIYLIARLVADMARVTNWISNIVNCGISLKLSDDEVLIMQITESAKNIKQLYQQKQDLSSIMMVRGSVIMGEI